jgi:transposase InsO family protein
MQGYIPYNDLINLFAVSESYLKLACYNYRKGKSTAWNNVKNHLDGRMRLIKLDSIPEKTRLKYNIPTVEQYECRQIIADDNLKKAKKETDLYFKKQALYNAYHSDWRQYYSIFYKKLDNVNQQEQRATKYAKDHAFWVKLTELTGKGQLRAYRGSLKPLYEIYRELRKEIPLVSPFSEYSNFQKKAKKVREALYYDTDITACHFSPLKFKKEPIKTTDFHKSMAFVYLSHPKQYAYRVVTDLVNHHADQEELQTISESWIKKLVANDKQFKTVVDVYRYGKKSYNDNIGTYISRKVSPFPANAWMIDGTPMQFYCWNDKRKQLIRMYLFTVIDVCTRKIVGFDLALSEDRFIIANALKMAVKLEGHLPSEIISDNFSANKTDEIKELQAQMLKLGTIWRHAKVGNAQDKAHAERFYGSFQSVECSLYDDYLGEGITSKRKNARPNKEFLEKVAKKTGYASFTEMQKRITDMICLYNERAIGNRKAPNEIYKELPKPNAVELNEFKTALLFWKKTTNTIRRSMVVLTIQKFKHHFEIKDHDLKLSLNGQKVTIRYDENDLSSVMLFDAKTDTAICECEQIVNVNIAQVDRTELDEFETLKQTAKKKSFESHIEKEALKIVSTGMQSVGKTTQDFEFQNPLGLAKNQINSQESKEMQDYFLLEKNINLELIKEYKSANILPEYLKGNDFDALETFNKTK